MTQVFADDDQVGDMGMRARAGQIPTQGGYQQPPSMFGPSMIAGKGVRPIRCVGCSRDTLPRHADGAPLCLRCSERLASAETAIVAASWQISALTPRWLRRRSAL